MNILITSAGRRVELVESFLYALDDLGLSNDSKVFCADLEPHLSSACYVGNRSFKLPHALASDYAQELLTLCLENSIKLVIPTNDNELLVFAESKDEFEKHGVTLLVSDKKLIEKCRDKRLTGSIFDILGIRYPTIYNKESLQFPCFCKPYDGSSSIGAHIVDSVEKLSESDVDDPKNIFMELVPKSFREYTVDAYFDKQNVLRAVVPRERISVRAGEVAKGITRKNYIYRALRDSARAIHGAVGCLTIQLFGNPESEVIIGLEVNPRFGGGYPLAIAAGADYSSMLIKEYLLNESIKDCDNWLDNTLMLRYDAKVVVKNANV